MRERRLKPWQRDALDQQDKELGLGRYEQVLCSDGRYRAKWQLGLAAANAEAIRKLDEGGMSRGRFLYVGKGNGR